MVIKICDLDLINIWDILNTLIGVLAGGIISIITSNRINRKSMKKQFMFDLLTEIKTLLREWEDDLLKNGVGIVECENIKQYRGDNLFKSAQVLNKKMELNKNFLSDFYSVFDEIKKKTLSIEMKDVDNKKSILELSKKYNTENVAELMEHEDVFRIIDNYGQEVLSLVKEIEALIAKINNYIYKEIL